MLQVNAKANLQAKLSLKSKVYSYLISVNPKSTRKIQISPVIRNKITPIEMQEKGLVQVVPTESMRKSLKEQDIIKRNKTMMRVLDSEGEA